MAVHKHTYNCAMLMELQLASCASKASSSTKDVGLRTSDTRCYAAWLHLLASPSVKRPADNDRAWCPTVTTPFAQHSHLAELDLFAA
jgi:hypothetical protein